MVLTSGVDRFFSNGLDYENAMKVDKFFERGSPPLLCLRSSTVHLLSQCPLGFKLSDSEMYDVLVAAPADSLQACSTPSCGACSRSPW